MTDNLKAFLEAVSQDKAFFEKLTKAKVPEAVIALATEKGFVLTTEDLTPEPASGEVSDDELDAVAGGKTCVCVAGGGGEAGTRDETCACVLGGAGLYVDIHQGKVIAEHQRCFCVMGGGGHSYDE